MSRPLVWLPDVRAVDRPQAAQVRLTLHVSPQLEHFAGHFPGLPILPGVVMVHWAIQFAQQHLPVFSSEELGAFQLLENVKFLGVVRPDMELQLQLEWDPARKRLTFKYFTQERSYASGRLAWGAAT